MMQEHLRNLAEAGHVAFRAECKVPLAKPVSHKTESLCFLKPMRGKNCVKKKLVLDLSKEIIILFKSQALG